MKLNSVRSFLLFLKDLISLSRKRWDQLTRRLWYIFALLRSPFSPRHPKEGDNFPRITGSPQIRSSQPTVICPSQLPQWTLALIAGGDPPAIASPAPSIAIRQATILDIEDAVDKSGEHDSAGHLGVKTYSSEEGRPLSSFHEETGLIDVVIPRGHHFPSAPVPFAVDFQGLFSRTLSSGASR